MIGAKILAKHALSIFESNTNTDKQTSNNQNLTRITTIRTTTPPARTITCQNPTTTELPPRAAPEDINKLPAPPAAARYPPLPYSQTTPTQDTETLSSTMHRHSRLHGARISRRPYCGFPLHVINHACQSQCTSHKNSSCGVCVCVHGMAYVSIPNSRPRRAGPRPVMIGAKILVKSARRYEQIWGQQFIMCSS